MPSPMQVDVVSIQSQVVYGQVGNNSAVPTLQSHGLRVAAVPTVVLSNTPHYPSVHGGALPAEWLAGYLDDLRARGALEQLRAVLVGYLGGPAQAAVLRTWLAALLDARPAVKVLLDPVIGDHDVGVYVDPGMVTVYRQELLPMADGLVPNGFELAQLSAMPVDDIASVAAAARSLMAGRTRWVVVTSAAPGTWPYDRMRVAIVTRDTLEVIEHARFDTTPKGTGDLFSATLAARLLAGDGIVDAARQASDRVLEVLQRSRAAGCEEMLMFPDGALS